MDTGRVVLITGAGGGVGARLVERFQRNGDTVIGTDASAEALARLGDELITETADISSEADCERVASVVREGPGHLDVLVNCAGYFPIVPFEEMTAADWRQIVDVNLTGTFLMVHTHLPLMKDRGW